jgi:hypothetical protein
MAVRLIARERIPRVKYWAGEFPYRSECDKWYTLDLLAELEPIKETASRFREAAIAHLQIMLAVDEFVATTEDARLAVTLVSFDRATMAIDPRPERQQHCRPTRLLAGDVDPFHCPIQDDGRARGSRWRSSLHSARCRVIKRRQASGGSKRRQYSTRARLYRILKSTSSKS